MEGEEKNGENQFETIIGIQRRRKKRRGNYGVGRSLEMNALKGEQEVTG